MPPPASMQYQGKQFSDSAYPGPSFQQASAGQNGRNFAFRKRYEKIDWRRIASIDIDAVARTLDFNALQDNIMNITFCSIEAELVSHNKMNLSSDVLWLRNLKFKYVW